MSDNINISIPIEDHHGPPNSNCNPCMPCHQEDDIHQCHVSEAGLCDTSDTDEDPQADIVLPLRVGVVSSEDKLHTVADINAELNMPTAAGLLPMVSTVTFGEWDLMRVDQVYICLVHQPTGVVCTHGSSLREAYDRARNNYGTDVLNLEVLDEYIDDSCEMGNEHDTPDCGGDEPSDLKQYTSGSMDEDDHVVAGSLPPAHKIVSEVVERLHATNRALTAQLQRIKEVHQKERAEQQQQQRSRVDAGNGQPITVDVDGPSRNTRSAKRLRRV